MPVIDKIEGVWRFTRPPRQHTTCHSTPGHLLHYIEHGEYRLIANNREYNIKSGDIIYYYDSERVEWFGTESDVSFISISFSSASFPPYHPCNHVFKGTDRERKLFEDAYEASLEQSSLRKNLRLLTACAGILCFLEEFRRDDSDEEKQNLMDPSDTWWRVEKKITRSRKFKATMDEMCSIAHCSRSTLLRRCKTATGIPPLSRLREIRMSEAMALIKNSTLNISQIADYLRYPRIHEFSRELKKHFKNPPSHYR